MFEKWKNRRFQNGRAADSALTVLAITASTTDRAQLQRIFEKTGWSIVFADSIEDALRQPVQIVVCDRDLEGADWREAIRQLARGPDRRCVILASFVADDYLWEEVIHCGGYDVLPKPFREDEVIHAIHFAWAAVTKSLPSAPRTR